MNDNEQNHEAVQPETETVVPPSAPGIVQAEVIPVAQVEEPVVITPPPVEIAPPVVTTPPPVEIEPPVVTTSPPVEITPTPTPTPTPAPTPTPTPTPDRPFAIGDNVWINEPGHEWSGLNAEVRKVEDGVAMVRREDRELSAFCKDLEHADPVRVHAEE